METKKNEESKGLFDKLQSYTLGLATVYLIVLAIGITYHICYYYDFNLPIRYFISVSEYSLLATNEIYFILIANVFIQLPILILNETAKHSGYKFSFKRKTNIIVGIVVIAIIILLLILTLTTEDKMFAHLYASFIVWLIPFLILMLDSVFPKPISIKQFNIVFFSTSLLVGIILYSGFSARFARNGHYNGTFIHLKDDRCYTSNDSLFFIGKTEKYIFLHNKKDTSNMIIDVDDIKTFILKSK